MSDSAFSQDQPSPAGEFGGSKRQRQRDVRMQARSVTERWPVPEDIRPALIKRLSMTALDPNMTPRDSTQAIRAILEADRINVDVELAELKRTEQDSLNLPSLVEEAEERARQRRLEREANRAPE